MAGGPRIDCILGTSEFELAEAEIDDTRGPHGILRIISPVGAVLRWKSPVSVCIYHAAHDYAERIRERLLSARRAVISHTTLNHRAEDEIYAGSPSRWHPHGYGY
jgi:hypothetical protein